MDDLKTHVRREIHRTRMREQYKNLSPEKKEKLLAKVKEQRKKFLENETPEERQARYDRVNSSRSIRKKTMPEYKNWYFRFQRYMRHFVNIDNVFVQLKKDFLKNKEEISLNDYIQCIQYASVEYFKLTKEPLIIDYIISLKRNELDPDGIFNDLFNDYLSSDNYKEYKNTILNTIYENIKAFQNYLIKHNKAPGIDIIVGIAIYMSIKEITLDYISILFGKDEGYLSASLKYLKLPKKISLIKREKFEKKNNI